MSSSPASTQHGNTLIGLIVGLCIGLAIAAVAAVYITNAPVPFVNKVQRPTENVQPGADGKLPDPNKPLYAPPPAPPKPVESVKAEPPAAAPAPAKEAQAPVAAVDEGTRFQLQAGAFRTPEDADAMRARLALMGLDARVFPIEQAGTTLYRVRLGPYGQIDDVNRTRKMLAENGIEAQVIRLR
ncbi:MAG: SPOR domain-containing protein [Burkholderiaceae bacterium]|nr:SPOR domain-containing protein [Burkholderiaceae bacterium]